MLDIEYIRNHPAEVKDAARRKRFDVDIDQLLCVDAERRAAIVELDAARQRRNELSALIPKLPTAERGVAVAEAKGLRDRIAQLEEKQTTAQIEFSMALLRYLVVSTACHE